MDKRRIAPTFMLPDKFPYLGDDIYVVLRGGIDNVVITSAQDFKYYDLRPYHDNKKVRQGNIMKYRCDDLTAVEGAIKDLVDCNRGFVDWAMALEQGQRAHLDLKRHLAGNEAGSDNKILRFTEQGRIYLPEKESK